MPLERFIPKSPDPFIRNSQDFEVAKFGHLNTIIEYVNTYVAADSLQLAGTGPLTSTARYITDSLGNTSTLAISTVNIGIGTTTPIVPLNIYNSSASVSSIVLVEQDTAAVVGQINQYRKNGSVNLTSGTEIGRISFGGYFNSTYSPFSQVCSAIYGYYGGTGTDRVGGLRLITWNGGGSSTRLQIAPDGKIAIGTTTATAKLQIVGEGSTSATTSLLVQNSIGTNLLQVKDNGLLTSNVDNEGGAFSIDVDTNAQTTLKLKPFGNNFNAAYQATIYNYYGNLVIKSAAYGNITTELFGNSQYRITDNFAYNYLTIYGANVGGKSVFGRPVEIKGIGSTFATTSLLVQNSSSINTLQVTDDGSLVVGTTASNLGVIYVPHSPTYGQRVFLAMQSGGRSLLSTYSNDGMGFKAAYNIFDGEILTNGLIGGAYQGTQGSGLGTAYNLTSGYQPYGTADYSFLNSGVGGRFQGASSGSFLRLSGTFQFDANNIFRGFYFNPTPTGAYSTQNIRAIESTYGGGYFNTTSVQASAILQADSTTQGFLPPRMTTAQRTAIVSPAAGLIVYDTTTNKSYTYDGTAWQAHW